MNFSGRGYKHLVPPGLEQSSNNTLLPHYQSSWLAKPACMIE